MLRWRPKRHDLYAVAGLGLIVWESFGEGRWSTYAVGLALLGYRLLAGPLQIGGLLDEEKRTPPPVPKTDE